MSKLLDKQVYVQIEILKIIFRGSRMPTKKCAMKMKKTKTTIFVVEGGIYKAVSEEWQDRFQ